MKRGFIWNKHFYVIGSVDTESGKIIEAHTEKQMAKWDFDAECVFSTQKKYTVLFEVDNEGKVVLYCPSFSDDFFFRNTTKEKRDFLTESIYKQIKVVAR